MWCICGPKRVMGDGDTELDKEIRQRNTTRSFALNDDRLIVYGILGRADARNRNGRIYPKPLLKREANAFYARHVQAERALGELDHPPPTSKTFRCLNVANVSHHVLEYFWKGNDLMGYVEVLNTPAGKMLRDLYEHGFQLGMSSRGWATLKEEDGFIWIQNDFELITFDFVSDPSTEGAYLRPLQRRYEHLKPPIAFEKTYLDFMGATVAGAKYLRENGHANSPPGSSHDSSNGIVISSKFARDVKNRNAPESEPIWDLALRATSVSGPGSDDWKKTNSVVNENSGKKTQHAPGTPPHAIENKNSSRSSSQPRTEHTQRRTSSKSKKVAPQPPMPTPASLRDSWNTLRLKGEVSAIL